MGEKDGIELKTQEILLTVSELARLLRVSPSWVYGRADELGAYRLGKYLRFALPRVMERLERGALGPYVAGSPTQRPSLTPAKGESSNGRGTD